jgi:hypothetical protein
MSDGVITLTRADGNNIVKRAVDCVEPWAYGEWLLVCQEAGDR